MNLINDYDSVLEPINPPGGRKRVERSGAIARSMRGAGGGGWVRFHLVSLYVRGGHIVFPKYLSKLPMKTYNSQNGSRGQQQQEQKKSLSCLPVSCLHALHEHPHLFLAGCLLDAAVALEAMDSAYLCGKTPCSPPPS